METMDGKAAVEVQGGHIGVEKGKLFSNWGLGLLLGASWLQPMTSRHSSHQPEFPSSLARYRN